MSTKHVIEINYDLDNDRHHWDCDCGAAGSVSAEMALGDPQIFAEKHVDEGDEVWYRHPGSQW